MSALRYTAVSARGVIYLVSQSALAILQAVCDGSELTYDDVSEHTGFSLSSLYVYCQRLERAGLITRRKVTARTAKSGLRRTTTFIARAWRVRELETRLVQ